MNIECSRVQQAIWTSEGAEGVLAHTESCEECRAEARRAFELGSALSGLQHRLVDIPPGLEARLVGLAGRSVLRRARDIASLSPRVWQGAAVGAAAAAAAVGIIVARRIARPAPELAA